jgi:hypothetical protein
LEVAEVRSAPRFLAAALCAVLLWAYAAFPARAAESAERVSTADLLQRWEEYDGREVVLTGEVVGDVMRRGDSAWITVNDDHYSRAARLEAGELRGGNSGIGVWISAKEAGKIGTLGRYGSKGDLVEVRGVFNADCREHGGDFDLHAASLTVIEQGGKLDTAPSESAFLAAAAALLFFLLTLSPYLRRRTREMRAARALLMEEGEEKSEG